MAINSITNNQSNNLKKIEYLRLHFMAEAEESCVLPSYLGSTLRGALGHAFRKNSCMAKKNTCNKCMFIKQCAYAYIFETLRDSLADQDYAMHAHIPHPFIIEPPEMEKRNFLPGDTIQFSVVLIGRAREYYPFFIMAFLEALENGLGKNRNRFRLRRVEQRNFGNSIIWNGGNQIVNAPVTELTPFSKTMEPVMKITINTITPMRIINKGQLVNELSFEVFIKSVFRRLDLLDKIHGSGQGLNIPFRDFLLEAREIEYLPDESHVVWQDWTRFSSRQNTDMQMGGIVGEFSYAGRLNSFLPWLMAAEALHVGKGTSFGLGRYKIKSYSLKQAINSGNS